MNVQIQTAQNVEIEYELASIGERMGGVIIDMLIQIGYIIGMLLILTAFVDGLVGNENLMIVIFILAYLPLFLYDFLCETFLDGQTFGKKAMKTRVVKLDGTQPGAGAYLLRWLIGLVEKVLFSGAIALVAMLVNGKGQRLGDMAAGTTVVRTKPAVTLEDTIFRTVESDYIPTFPQVTRLSDSDIALVQEVLNAGNDMANPVVMGRLASKLKQVLGVTSELPPAAFLRVLMKDYNYYTNEC